MSDWYSFTENGNSEPLHSNGVGRGDKFLKPAYSGSTGLVKESSSQLHDNGITRGGNQDVLNQMHLGFGVGHGTPLVRPPHQALAQQAPPYSLHMHSPPVPPQPTPPLILTAPNLGLQPMCAKETPMAAVSPAGIAPLPNPQPVGSTLQPQGAISQVVATPVTSSQSASSYYYPVEVERIGPMGLELTEGEHWKVVAIVKGSAQTWNERCDNTFPTDKIQIGDFVVSVNGKDSQEAIVEEMSKQEPKSLFLVMCRRLCD